MTRRPPPARTSRRARGAVAVLFFVNGGVFADAVPRYPELKAGLALSNAAFGSVVAAFPLGALLAGTVAGVLVGRWGSARALVAASVVMAADLAFIGVAPSWWALACALFVAGSFDARSRTWPPTRTDCGWSGGTGGRSSTRCTACGASARSSAA